MTDHVRDAGPTLRGLARDHRGHASSPSPAATGTRSSRAPRRARDERIVVNMGPQHPSTHGVLRLILELDGETVTEARVRHRLPAHRHREEHGVPQLDPGRHVRARGWTTCRRSSTRPRTASAVEKLLGITDQIPERASVIRVHADGAEPDLLAPGLRSPPAAWSSARSRAMIYGFRERETHPRPLRADHRPADEPRVHPARRRRPGPAAGRGGQDPRVRARCCAGTCTSTTNLLTGNPIWQGPDRRTSATSTWPAAWRSASPARCCARPACRTTCARSQPYCGYETYDFDVADPRHLRRLRAVPGPPGRDARVAEDRRAVPGPAARRARSWSPTRRSPGRPSWPSAPTAWATPSTTSGTSWATSMEALIHHFKLVTEGFRVPAGQVYAAGRVAARRARRARRLRRRHAPLPRALPRPVVHQPAGDRGDVRGRP